MPSIELFHTVWQRKQCSLLDWRLIASEIIITSNFLCFVLRLNVLYCTDFSHSHWGFGSTVHRPYLRGLISYLNGNMDHEAC